MWRRFARHRLALAALVVLALFYLLALFAEFVAPYDPERIDKDAIHRQPQLPRWHAAEGFQLRPFVYGFQSSVDLENFQRVFVLDEGQKWELRFFVHGDRYRFWVWRDNQDENRATIRMRIDVAARPRVA